MTHHEETLCAIALDQVRGLAATQIVERLLAEGLLNLRACERLAVCAEVERLTKRGMPRCEALHAAAEKLCCSYETARSSYYTHIKNRKK